VTYHTTRSWTATLTLLLLAGCLMDQDRFDALLAETVDQDGDGFPALRFDGTDCDDEDSTIYPGADETCDAADNDCDDVVDEDAEDTLTWYVDADADGYGDVAAPAYACESLPGHADNPDDCDDDDPAATPETVWYVDADGDGWGLEGYTTQACEQPPGYADRDGDCDDGADTSFPGADEICDGADNDCDEEADEAGAIDALTWYPDDDGDDYGSDADSVRACDPPSDDWTTTPGDCDDGDGDVNPEEQEICGNGVDDDCDGTPSGCGHEGEISVTDADVKF